MRNGFRLGGSFMQMNLSLCPLWFLPLGSQTLSWCCKANWGKILQYNKFSFECFLWLINNQVLLWKILYRNALDSMLSFYNSNIVSSSVFIKILISCHILKYTVAPCWVEGLCLFLRLHVICAIVHRYDAFQKFLTPRSKCSWACFL